VKDFQKQFGVIAAIGGGAALGLAPQTGLWWLAWFALAPLWVYLGATEKPETFRLGMLFGMVYHGIMAFPGGRVLVSPLACGYWSVQPRRG
jgi:apolipoprotein N-acyltransferase